MNENKYEKLKSKLRTLHQIALEIGREAEKHNKELDKNTDTLSLLMNSVYKNIYMIGNTINKKFNIFIYMLIISLFFIIIVYFLL